MDHYWKEQRVVLDGLMKRIEAETLPTLVLGDWNLPDFGPRYRRLTRNLQDAHLVGGKGFGHTFPGDLPHWAAFGQPWMRIDYVLTDKKHWRVEECRVQTASEAALSQHRALLVRLRRQP
jgi:endonuclease/exonuclease/phosphatase family metal-dependent hydrolase